MGLASTVFSGLLGGIVQRGQIFLGTAGAICAAAGAWQMYGTTTHSMSGVTTSAVLESRFSKCLAEFQPKGEARRKEPMDCDSAYAFRNAVGSKKVKVHKTDHATVRYTLSDGSSRTATVYEGKLETRGKPPGTVFEAVYDPADPNDVRARPNLSSVGFTLAMIFGGLAALGLALLPQVLGLFGSRASRQQATTSAAQSSDAAAWGEDALKDAIARKQSAASRASAVPSDSRPGRGLAAAVEPRRQFGMRGR